MAENPKNDGYRRVVKLSASADRDQSIIYAYTADQWGENQAEAYLDFLGDAAARQPTRTRADNIELENHPHLYCSME